MYPLVLSLNAFGQPIDFVDYETAVCAYVKGHVVWEHGDESEMYTIRGGTNRLTGLQSSVIVKPIIMIRNSESGSSGGAAKVNMTPRLTNRNLFHRDVHTCAYCGKKFGDAALTRDHVIPVSKGGEDKWMNVVAACNKCNNFKADRTPEQADMPLLFAPYVPSHAENLILSNRKILPSQLEFLRPMISANSRVFANV